MWETFRYGYLTIIDNILSPLGWLKFLLRTAILVIIVSVSLTVPLISSKIIVIGLLVINLAIWKAHNSYLKKVDLYSITLAMIMVSFFIGIFIYAIRLLAG